MTIRISGDKKTTKRVIYQCDEPIDNGLCKNTAEVSWLIWRNADAKTREGIQSFLDEQGFTVEVGGRVWCREHKK